MLNSGIGVAQCLADNAKHQSLSSSVTLERTGRKAALRSSLVTRVVVLQQPVEIFKAGRTCRTERRRSPNKKTFDALRLLLQSDAPIVRQGHAVFQGRFPCWASDIDCVEQLFPCGFA